MFCYSGLIALLCVVIQLLAFTLGELFALCALLCSLGCCLFCICCLCLMFCFY